MLIDFTKKVEDFIIVTDATERAQGLSNACVTFQNSQQNKSHFFYAHLEPQPNGAAFAGFKIKRAFDLSHETHMHITLKKLIHQTLHAQCVITTEESDQAGCTYQSDFCLNQHGLTNISLKLKHFSATRRGEPYPSAPDLNLSHISSLGIRIVGRVNPDLKQAGLFGLQLHTWRASSNKV